MHFDLQKTFERGTWRWIGQRVRGVSSSGIPIGASDIRSIIRHTGGKAFRVGRIKTTNAVVIERPPFRLLYVRPQYAGYRYAATRVFPSTRWKIDFDHALGRRIAIELGYSYVLLIRIPPGINRAHGRYERPVPMPGYNLKKLCFADRRILDKWIGRSPNLMGDALRLRPYRPSGNAALGLSLKQSGKWGFAMGVEEDPLPIGCLAPLSDDTRS